MDFRMKVSMKKIIMGVMACFGLGQAALAESIPDFKKFYRAANQENTDAQLNLGMLYANGQGVGKDYEKALKWFRRAAGHGDAIGQYNLGVA